MPSPKRAGTIGGYWLSQRSNSRVWCATWFDPATRQTRRASLGTTDVREAEIALAEYVVQHAKPKDAKPEDTTLEAVLLRYWNDHAKHQPSAEAERFGLRYWSQLMPGVTVAELTPERQERFIAALRDRGLSESYIRGFSRPDAPRSPEPISGAS